jgi:hypothetical protein
MKYARKMDIQVTTLSGNKLSPRPFVKIALWQVKTNSYFYNNMWKSLVKMYHQYKDYVRVDLVMYAVMLIMILLYVIFSLAFR